MPVFRIRRIHDDLIPSNREAIRQVQEILRTQFPGAPASDSADLPEKLRDPFKYRFRTIVFVADDPRGRVKGFALLLHAPDLRFCYLDFMSAVPSRTGSGIGGALYQRLREEAIALNCIGLFFECLPDDPALSPDPETRAQNARRLRFYERYGARPIDGTRYETPLEEGQADPPYLVYDSLGRDAPLPRRAARSVVRAILERKYGALCPPAYVEMVVASFRDDPVRLRPFRYVKKEPLPPAPAIPSDDRIALAVADGPPIRHQRERGWVEAPVSIPSILGALESTGLFSSVPVRRHPDRLLEAVHDRAYLAFLQRVCASLGEEAIYPDVFPIRGAATAPKDRAVRAGYYCVDTFTPLNASVWSAARRGVDCALTAADELLSGRRQAYALSSLPGHHAGRRNYGGFCYLNSAAVAAHHLGAHGDVAILDLDFHHGSGLQEIFYERPDVLTISIHGHPSVAYPYFSGEARERGRGEGEGFNLNLPLLDPVDGDAYLRTLELALEKVEAFAPSFVVIAMGFDGGKADPTGSWSLGAKDFDRIGRRLGRLRLPTLVVQEGGFETRSLGLHARRFFTGLWEGARRSESAVRTPRPPSAPPDTPASAGTRGNGRSSAAPDMPRSSPDGRGRSRSGRDPRDRGGGGTP